MGDKNQKSFICTDCFRLKRCKEPLASWLFFSIAIIAVISLRAVNIFIDFNPLIAKTLWYVGVTGFLVFFIYKFHHHNILHRELNKTNLVEKLLSKEKLSEHDYEVLGTILCSLSSKKDKINYFLIFFFSAVALIIAIYADFFKR
ncbi:MAG: hypothetical protein KJ593_04935 [Candidatus Omnitrophica bacterium]|nr:hypothetical protein [Candidatus Omnitrophota bacterium]